MRTQNYDAQKDYSTKEGAAKSSRLEAPGRRSKKSSKY